MFEQRLIKQGSVVLANANNYLEQVSLTGSPNPRKSLADGGTGGELPVVGGVLFG